MLASSFLAVLKNSADFLISMVDCSERRSTPAETTDRGDTTDAESVKEALRTPRGKRPSATKINTFV